MSWENIICKDIVSHSALTTGVEPKGKYKISESFINRLIDNFIEETKRNATPYHALKNIALDYVNYKEPEVLKVMQDENLSYEEAFQKIYSNKEWIKFAVKNQTTGRIKRLFKGD
jgi:hypothetical protein